MLNFRVIAVRDKKFYSILFYAVVNLNVPWIKKINKLEKGQRTNQKYRNLVGSDQQMQRLKETELRKADGWGYSNCYICYNIS